jgi:spore coat polysaccharide biosynthesis predicted glycosyltransferase SpsG
VIDSLIINFNPDNQNIEVVAEGITLNGEAVIEVPSETVVVAESIQKTEEKPREE